MAAPKKEVKGYIKLEIPAGKANPAPPVGPALGQNGLNISEFCSAFNEATSSMEAGMPVPVVITAYADRTFTFVTKTPPASYLLRKAAKIAKGSGVPNRDKVGKVKVKDIRAIAETKMKDLNAVSIEAAMNTISGTARSMGIEVEG